MYLPLGPDLQDFIQPSILFSDGDELHQGLQILQVPIYKQKGVEDATYHFQQHNLAVTTYMYFSDPHPSLP